MAPLNSFSPCETRGAASQVFKVNHSRHCSQAFKVFPPPDQSPDACARSFPRALIFTPPLLPGLSSQPTPPPTAATVLQSTPPPRRGAPRSLHPRLPLTSAPALSLQRGSLHSPASLPWPRWGRPSPPPSLSAARSEFLL